VKHGVGESQLRRQTPEERPCLRIRHELDDLGISCAENQVAQSCAMRGNHEFRTTKKRDLLLEAQFFEAVRGEAPGSDLLFDLLAVDDSPAAAAKRSRSG